MLRPSGVASLSFGATSNLSLAPGDQDVSDEEDVEVVEEVEDVAVASQRSRPLATTTTSTMTTTTTTNTAVGGPVAGRQSRPNRGANMAKIIRTVYGGVSRGAVTNVSNEEQAESDEEDPDYNE
jgi:hypothetical protein